MERRSFSLFLLSPSFPASFSCPPSKVKQQIKGDAHPPGKEASPPAHGSEKFASLQFPLIIHFLFLQGALPPEASRLPAVTRPLPLDVQSHASPRSTPKCGLAPPWRGTVLPRPVLTPAVFLLILNIHYALLVPSVFRGARKCSESTKTARLPHGGRLRFGFTHVRGP